MVMKRQIKKRTAIYPRYRGRPSKDGVDLEVSMLFIDKTKSKKSLKTTKCIMGMF